MPVTSFTAFLYSTCVSRQVRAGRAAATGVGVAYGRFPCASGFGIVPLVPPEPLRASPILPSHAPASASIASNPVTGKGRGDLITPPSECALWEGFFTNFQ